MHETQLIAGAEIQEISQQPGPLGIVALHRAVSTGIFDKYLDAIQLLMARWHCRLFDLLLLLQSSLLEQVVELD